MQQRVSSAAGWLSRPRICQGWQPSKDLMHIVAVCEQGTAAHLDVGPAGVGKGNIPELDVGSLRAALGLGMPCRDHLGRPIQKRKHPCAGTHRLSCTTQF